MSERTLSVETPTVHDQYGDDAVITAALADSANAEFFAAVNADDDRRRKEAEAAEDAAFEAWYAADLERRRHEDYAAMTSIAGAYQLA